MIVWANIDISLKTFTVHLDLMYVGSKPLE